MIQEQILTLENIIDKEIDGYKNIEKLYLDKKEILISTTMNVAVILDMDDFTEKYVLEGLNKENMSKILELLIMNNCDYKVTYHSNASAAITADIVLKEDSYDFIKI